jgi:AraC-like DNA-binding protein
MLIMDLFLVAAVVTAVVFLAGVLLARNLRYKALATFGRTYGAAALVACAFMMVSNLLAGNDFIHRIPVDIMIALISLSVLTNAFMSVSRKKAIVIASIGVASVGSLYYILCASGVLLPAGPKVMGIAAYVLSGIWVSIYVYTVSMRLWKIHDLMQSGSVWTVLCLSVDSMHAIGLVFLMGFYATFSASAWACAVSFVLLSFMLVAMGVRIACDSVFALFHRHERRIVESMRISPVESASVSPGQENMYKELYDRIQTYFDEEKPYLNGSLTINDVVARVFSNKVYISRAIGQCTGRNFCQYVNYHRVMFAMECFRNNTDLKISELWQLCGFNTIVSFNMAFRLFMDENPSDWCRKEKIRLSKKRK